MPNLQWSLFRADLNPVRGSEQAGTRPVLVVSREALNRSLSIVGVCPLTSLKIGRKIYSTEVLVPAGTAGTLCDSLVMTHQFRTIAKERLGTKLGDLGEEHLRQAVREALSVYLDLDR